MEPHNLMRSDGWEERLALALKEATLKHFHVKQWNCARFAHAIAEAVTGRALPYEFKGSLEASVDALFSRHTDTRAMQRGDVVLANVPHATLGVCVGAELAFVMEAKGLLLKPRSEAVIAWRV
jgi:hypothetical protein